LIPGIIGTAMLVVIIAAALTPNVGIGSAQANCQYNCSNVTGLTALDYALIGVLVAVIVAALVALLIFQRRKNRGKGGAGGVAAWEEPQGGSPPSGPSMGNTGGAGSMAPVGAAAVGGAGVGAAATYDETTPAETGPEWAEPAAPATVGAAAGTGAAMEESEPDIDRLMKELDQISDDILKKSPPKKGSPPDAPPADDADT
jgi:tetrahydromethanopterin S-methyltransferase subunit B